MHSQRLNEKLLLPWIICGKDGSIISAHCNCIAGLGEVCTHVAAVLFAIDNCVRELEVKTPTGIKAYWMPPTGKAVEPKRVQEMDFSTAKKKRVEEGPMIDREKEKLDIPPVTHAEKHTLLQNLEKAGSVLHLVTKPFSTQIMEVTTTKKSLSLNVFYKEEYETLSLVELQKLGM